MDRFDDIWKDRFNEEQLPIGDWNTPDDEVWKGILPHVEPKKEKKRRWWWMWFGIGNLLVLVAIVFLSQNKNETVLSQDVKSNEISETSEPTNYDSNIVRTGVDMSEVASSSTQSQSTSPTIDTEIISVNVPPSNNIKTKFQKSIYISASKDVFQQKNIITDTEKAIKLNSPESSTFKFLETNNGLEISLDGKNEVIDKLSWSMLPSLEMLLQKRILPTHNLPELKLLDIDFPSERKIRFGFSTGAVFWKHRISNNYTELLDPFDFNYEDGLGWQANLEMKIPFLKIFEGTIGFQYEQINTKSGHNSDVPYSLDNEMNGNPLNGYALSLATPYGLSAATFNFIRTQDIGANSADLLVDFHSTHVIKNISIPVGLNIFPFGKKNKWVPSAHIGFGTNYLADISNNIQSIDTNHDAIQFDDSGTSTFVSPELEKWHFDYRLGLGVTYQINSESSFQLNYDWSRGINPIFKFEDYNTRIDRHYISMGFSTKLKLRKP